MWTMKMKGGLGSLDLNPPKDRGFFCDTCERGKRESEMYDDDLCESCKDDLDECAKRHFIEEQEQAERDRLHELKLEAQNEKR